MKRKPLLAALAILGAIAGIAIGLSARSPDRATPTPATPTPATSGATGAAASASQQAGRPPRETLDPRFQTCAHCHQVGPGARNSSGPVLTGLLGRKAAATDYPYSRAMRQSGLVWDEQTLRAFLDSPQSVVPGTRMAFGGIEGAELENLILFLKEQEAR
ncbi:MAG: cytochrome c family protein [Methylobacterium mesophilicum]|nr:cytochrome c family protein [Methylobacterium mesophilicum]